MILLLELIFLRLSWLCARALELGLADRQFDVMTNTHAIGHVLYTEYIYLFQAAGMILLVAMVGAIVLTLASA